MEQVAGQLKTGRSGSEEPTFTTSPGKRWSKIAWELFFWEEVRSSYLAIWIYQE